MIHYTPLDGLSYRMCRLELDKEKYTYYQGLYAKIKMNKVTASSTRLGHGSRGSGRYAPEERV